MNAPIDLVALKSRQQTAWASGDYALIGTTLQLVGEQLAEACDLRLPRHLDRLRRVACSSAAPNAPGPNAST